MIEEKDSVTVVSYLIKQKFIDGTVHAPADINSPHFLTNIRKNREKIYTENKKIRVAALCSVCNPDCNLII